MSDDWVCWWQGGIAHNDLETIVPDRTPFGPDSCWLLRGLAPRYLQDQAGELRRMRAGGEMLAGISTDYAAWLPRLET
jgi:hypothetical protein